MQSLFTSKSLVSKCETFLVLSECVWAYNTPTEWLVTSVVMGSFVCVALTKVILLASIPNSDVNSQNSLHYMRLSPLFSRFWAENSKNSNSFGCYCGVLKTSQHVALIIRDVPTNFQPSLIIPCQFDHLSFSVFSKIFKFSQKRSKWLFTQFWSDPHNFWQKVGPPIGPPSQQIKRVPSRLGPKI